MIQEQSGRARIVLGEIMKRRTIASDDRPWYVYVYEDSAGVYYCGSGRDGRACNHAVGKRDVMTIRVIQRNMTEAEARALEAWYVNDALPARPDWEYDPSGLAYYPKNKLENRYKPKQAGYRPPPIPVAAGYHTGSDALTDTVVDDSDVDID